jgi:hypothetical protein
LIESTKNLEKTLLIPLKIRVEEKKERKKTGKYFVNRPYCEGLRA